MSDDKPQKPPPDPRAAARRAALFGVVLALICNLLPHHLQTPCKMLASVCTGGNTP